MLPLYVKYTFKKIYSYRQQKRKVPNQSEKLSQTSREAFNPDLINWQFRNCISSSYNKIHNGFHSIIIP
jgi:hypothetical protein